MLLKGKSNAAIQRLTGVSTGTFSRIKDAHLTNNQEALDKLLDPENHSPGAPPRLSKHIELRICARIKEAAARGFAVDVDGIRDVAARCAEEYGKSFAKHRPSPEWVRLFRARHRDLTLRKHENKDIAKLHAEDYDHVHTLKTALQQVVARHPNIATNPRLFWNFDETEVTGEFGKNVKVFTSASSKRGGFRAAGRDTGCHLTACVIANAVGDVLPPLFIFAGKNIMSAWTEPLPSTIWKDQEGIPKWYALPHWHSSAGEAVLRGTPNGSMDKATITFVIEHIKQNTKLIIPDGEHMLLLLDGHKSRNGFNWLESARDAHIEVVQSPANTTHKLQACDDTINKAFKRAVRETRDEIAAKSLVNFGDMQLKLILGVAGFRALNRTVVSEAFFNVGLWPLDYRFTHQFNKKKETEVSIPTPGRDLIDEVKHAVRSGASPRDICATINEAVGKASSKAAVVDSLFQERENAITRNKTNSKTRKVLACGQSAAYLTLPGVIKHRKNEDDKRRRSMAEKEELKTKEKQLLDMKKNLEEQLKGVRQLKREVGKKASKLYKSDVHSVQHTLMGPEIADQVEKGSHVQMEQSDVVVPAVQTDAVQSVVQTEGIATGASADWVLTGKRDTDVFESTVMALKTEKATNPQESDSRDARCVDALLGLCNGGEGVTEEIDTMYDESVGDQACLEEPEYSKKYFGQFGVYSSD